jgi:hypothetical protein
MKGYFLCGFWHKESFSMEDLFGLEIVGGITNGLHELGYEMLVVHVDPRYQGNIQTIKHARNQAKSQDGIMQEKTEHIQGLSGCGRKILATAGFKKSIDFTTWGT